MKKLAKKDIVAFVDGNKDTFVGGNVFTEEAINRFAEIVRPDLSDKTYEEVVKAVQTVQTNKLTVQFKINKVLATKGLYMAQKDRHSYVIKSNDKASTRAKSYKSAARRKTLSAARLTAGIERTVGIWSK